MRGEPCDHNGPTVFATHSTHKLLNALSQASYIHVREGRGAVNFSRFNRAYMMHATTSPLYAICASNDVAVSMMDGNSGLSLTQEVIDEAVDFRQAMARLYKEFTDEGDWFFKPWNKDVVTDPQTGKTYDFADAPAKLLATDQNCWVMRPEKPGTALKTCRITGVCWTRLKSVSRRRVWATMANWKHPAYLLRWSQHGLAATVSCRPAPPTSRLCSCSLWGNSREMGNADQHAVLLQTSLRREYAAGAGDAGTGAGLS